MFDGDWHLVLAAYNGGLGPGAARDEALGRDDFWSLAESSATCRGEPANTCR